MLIDIERNVIKCDNYTGIGFYLKVLSFPARRVWCQENRKYTNTSCHNVFQKFYHNSSLAPSWWQQQKQFCYTDNQFYYKNVVDSKLSFNVI